MCHIRSAAAWGLRAQRQPQEAGVGGVGPRRQCARLIVYRLLFILHPLPSEKFEPFALFPLNPKTSPPSTPMSRPVKGVCLAAGDDCDIIQDLSEARKPQPRRPQPPILKFLKRFHVKGSNQSQSHSTLHPSRPLSTPMYRPVKSVVLGTGENSDRIEDI